jgi:hypothetical protein
MRKVDSRAEFEKAAIKQPINLVLECSHGT